MTASGTPDATNFITSFADAESLEVGCVAVACEGTDGVVGPVAAVEFVAISDHPLPGSNAVAMASKMVA